MKVFLGGVAALTLTLAPALPAETALTRGPYLQLGRPDAMTVVWRTEDDLAHPGVRYGTDPQSLDGLCSGRQVLRRTLDDGGGADPLDEAPEGTVQFEATLEGLEPRTLYYYQVVDGTEVLGDAESADEQTFRTHPRPGRPTPTRVWVVGDSGTGTEHQLLVHEAMQRWTAASERPLDLYLHVGDMAYGSGTDPQFQERFFEPYAQTLSKVVCWAAMGNHEGRSSDGKTGIGPFYDAYVCPVAGEAGGVPSGFESFYSFDYGDAHFVALDSHDLDRRPDGRMAQWLARDLASTDARWRIAFFHHPPYSKGSHNSDTEQQLVEMREWIMPILEEHGIDLVLSGHSHIYERSMLIDGAYVTPTTAEGVVLDDGDGRPDGDGAYEKPARGGEAHRGTVAIVTGHGGALASREKGVMPVMRTLILDHGSTILDIDGDTLTGIMLDLRAQERDGFVMVKKEGAELASVLPDPWTPSASDIERTGAGVEGGDSGAGERDPALIIPDGITRLIKSGDEWSYLAGGETPPEGWAGDGLDASDWEAGRGGFGYGDGDDRTTFDDMRGDYSTIFIRREVALGGNIDRKKLGLIINYDDGFSLWINGVRAMERNVRRDANGAVTKVIGHEADDLEYYSLAGYADLFREGANVIAFEGHNTSLGSSDLSLDPQLVVEE